MSEKNQPSHDQPFSNNSRNMGSLTGPISSFFASLATLISTLGRGTFGGLAYVIFGVGNAIRNASGFVVGALAESSNVVTVVFMFAASSIAALAIGLRRGVGYVAGFFSEGFSVFVQAGTMLGGVVAESFMGVVAIASEFFNLLRIPTAMLAAFFVGVFEQARVIFSVVASGFAEAAYVVIAIGAELVNVLRLPGAYLFSGFIASLEAVRAAFFYAVAGAIESATFVVAALTELANLARVPLGVIFAAGTSFVEGVRVAWALVAAGVVEGFAFLTALGAEFLNLTRIPGAYIYASVVAIFEGARFIFAGIAAGVSEAAKFFSALFFESINLLRIPLAYILGAAAGVVETGRLLMAALIAGFHEAATFLSALFFEFLNVMRLPLAYVSGGVVAAFEGLRVALAVLIAGLAEGFAMVAAFFATLGNILRLPGAVLATVTVAIYEAIRFVAAVVLSGIGEFLTGLGVFFAEIMLGVHQIGALFLAALSELSCLGRRGGGYVVASFWEGIKLAGALIGVVLGGLVSVIYGLFGGGVNGLKTCFSHVVDFIKSNVIVGESFAENSLLDLVGGKYVLGEAFTKSKNALLMGYQSGDAVKKVYEENKWGDSFRYVYKTLGEGYRVDWIGQVWRKAIGDDYSVFSGYKAIYTETSPLGSRAKDAINALGGEYRWSVVKTAYNYFAESYTWLGAFKNTYHEKPIGRRAQDTFKDLGGLWRTSFVREAYNLLGNVKWLDGFHSVYPVGESLLDFKTAKAVFRDFGGAYQWSRVTTAYDYLTKEYGWMKGFNSVYAKEQMGDRAKHVFKDFGGSYQWASVVKSYEFFAKNFKFLNGFNSIYTESAPMGSRAKEFLDQTDGHYRWSVVRDAYHAIRDGYAYMKGFDAIYATKPFGERAKDVYDALGGSFDLQRVEDVFNIVIGRDPNATPPIPFAFLKGVKAIYGERYENFGTYYQYVRDLVDPYKFLDYFWYVSSEVGGTESPLDVASDIYQKKTAHINWGQLFNSIYDSELFGKKPWMKQQVAADMFYIFSGYKLEDGPRKQMEDDFVVIQRYTDFVISGSSGFGTGAVGLGCLLIPYMIYGGANGFINAGIPGLLGGVAYGFWKSMTFPFRNSYRELLNTKRSSDMGRTSASDFVTLDMHQLAETGQVVPIFWEVMQDFSNVAANEDDMNPSYDVITQTLDNAENSGGSPQANAANVQVDRLDELEPVSLFKQPSTESYTKLEETSAKQMTSFGVFKPPAAGIAASNSSVDALKFASQRK